MTPNTAIDTSLTPDPHSRLQTGKPRTVHFDWQAAVDFDSSTLRCSIRLRFDRPGPDSVDLDIRHLDIQAVRTIEGAPLPFTVGADDPILGEGLSFELPADLDTVIVDYQTTRDSTALQWAPPEQTSSGTGHFLYSQCQTIHARSMIPLHDSMSAKSTYTAKITVPAGYTALMPAEMLAQEARDHATVFSFQATTPRAPYLMALAVGHLASREISPRSRIWAEPSQIDAAAWEFAEVETMLTAAEEFFGPYQWGRLDLLIMPQSYPYGGLENPGLVFLTPTLIAGDRSLTDVLIHEIAHHWSGNLVTGASMDHFWINEGFTTYGERRISETLYGRELAELRAAMGLLYLKEDFEFLQDRMELSRLRMNLRGLDPDATSTWVAHEKGSIFIRALEESVGRERFDPFFKGFFRDFAFGSLTTEDFIAYATDHLNSSIDYEEWLYGNGLPASVPPIESTALTRVREVGQSPVQKDDASTWDASMWTVYLGQLEPDNKTDVFFQTMDSTFDLLDHQNPEIRRLWLLLGVRAGYAPAVEASMRFLSSTGRMKYLKPLYDALVANVETQSLAVECYRRNREGYHPIARAVVESRLSRLGFTPDELTTTATEE
ncbi:hydrolase/aminopeptidase [Arthrobacter sp. MYb23]|uniref:M1 family metallopeptidase n=1 Tax=unclassified Arthrobacter TaxID=235627 RepID=UPI000CFE21CB|nr:MULTISPECIES: M1 family metallopeptidase [unclassified Arthrobacter]PRB43062.1 hydrolase/aminopeptidase [Arthrobacter sp. MYb51]PRB98014.1 hydrolase/aminopeptidase [Arthrobacter sp. MYb23]